MILNTVEHLNENDTKTIKYTVELYKNEVLADSFENTKTVQYLSNEQIEVDASFFNNAHTLYDGYTINRVIYNGNELPIVNGVIEVENKVNDGTVFKIYYNEIVIPPTEPSSSSSQTQTQTKRTQTQTKRTETQTRRTETQTRRTETQPTGTRPTPTTEEIVSCIKEAIMNCGKTDVIRHCKIGHCVKKWEKVWRFRYYSYICNRRK